MYRDWVEKDRNIREYISPPVYNQMCDNNTFNVDSEIELGQDLDFFLNAYQFLDRLMRQDDDPREVLGRHTGRYGLKIPKGIEGDVIDWMDQSAAYYGIDWRRKGVSFIKYGNVLVQFCSGWGVSTLYAFNNGIMISRNLTQDVPIVDILNARYGNSQTEDVLKEMDSLLNGIVHGHPKREAILRKWRAFRKEFND